MNREREKLENKKEAEELQRLKELFLWEQCMQEQKKEEQKRNTMKAHMVRYLDVINVQMSHSLKQYYKISWGCVN